MKQQLVHSGPLQVQHHQSSFNGHHFCDQERSCDHYATRHTAHSHWYIEHCLPKVLDAVMAHHPRTHFCCLLLHHDNAPAHRANQTKDFLAENQVQELLHPPYSPNLAPCDFFMFPQVKSQLHSIHYYSPEEAVEAFMKVLEEIPAWSGPAALVNGLI